MEKFNSPHRGWYLAQARPDLTAKDPTSTRLVLQVGFEPNNPSFQELRLKRSVSRQLHHCSISKLSVQQSTVFPICQTVSPNRLPTRSSRWCFGWDLNPHACAEVFETPLSANSSTETYMLVFPSRHCLRRSLLYFKHHVVHVIIFTVIDRCSDNILRIWV